MLQNHLLLVQPRLRAEELQRAKGMLVFALVLLQVILVAPIHPIRLLNLSLQERLELIKSQLLTMRTNQEMLLQPQVLPQQLERVMLVDLEPMIIEILAMTQVLCQLLEPVEEEVVGLVPQVEQS